MSITTDITTEHTLTRDEVKALRNADTAVFRWNHKDEAKPDVLELVKEVKRTDGFGTDDKRIDIPAAARVANYGGHGWEDESSRLDPAVSGTWVRLYVQSDPVWNTFVAFVKPGDRLEQEWVVDNRNELLKKAHLTHHELKVRVIRPIKDSDNAKVHTFLMDASVHNPHGLADSVRRERRS